MHVRAAQLRVAVPYRLPVRVRDRRDHPHAAPTGVASLAADQGPTRGGSHGAGGS